jgi:putative transcriptional regulator
MGVRGGKAPSSAAAKPAAPSPAEPGEGGRRKAFDPRVALVVTNHIRRMRFEKGEMTQQELADLVGVTRQTVNAIEGAKYIPTLELAFRISRVFGVGVEGVFEVG